MVAGLACWSLAGLLLLLVRRAPFSLARYLAGELGSAAICGIVLFFLGGNSKSSWQVPGATSSTCQLLIGAVLPRDQEVHVPAWVGQIFSLVGAGTLILPALLEVYTDYQVQASQAQACLVYEVVLFVEALGMTFWGLGTRSQPFVIVGFSLVGAATLGGIGLTHRSITLPLMIIIFGILLLLLITWYTLRTRRSASAQ